VYSNVENECDVDRRGTEVYPRVLFLALKRNSLARLEIIDPTEIF
jgi:hypothetical protein